MDEKKRQIWQNILNLIETHGVAITCVHPELGKPSFSYTIGLAKVNLPDLVIMGVHQSVGANILNDVQLKLKSGEFRGFDGEILKLTPQSPLLKLRELHEHDVKNVMIATIRYSQETGVPMKFMQVIFPDENGSFPEDQNCDPEYSRIQSLIDFK